MWYMNKPTIQYVAAKALIKNEQGQVLVLKQADPTITGDMQYHPPGGIVELGETVRECVEREVQEEIGVPCTAQSLFDVGEWYAERAGTVMQFVGIFYVCNIISDNFTLQSAEASGFMWVDATNIDALPILEPSMGIIRKFLASAP